MGNRFNSKDITGQKFGKLTALRFVERRADKSRSEYYWEFQCECGNTCITRRDRVTTGLKPVGSCGCERNRDKWSGYKEISGSQWGSIKKGAVKRGIVFDVTIEEAWDLFEQQRRRCALTGIELAFNQVKSTPWYENTTASLDRIDSSEGYVLGNIQWLHKDVNQMKWNLTTERLVELSRLIVENRIEKGD